MVNIKKNPIINYRADIATDVSQIPFPAVTYCSALYPPDKFHDFNFIEDLTEFYTEYYSFVKSV